MKNYLSNLLVSFFRFLYYRFLEYEAKNNEKEYGLNGVRLGYHGYINGNIQIGDNTYINERFRIVTGKNSEIVIGRNCAIGRNFSCASRTHSLKRPTTTSSADRHLVVEENIYIGQGVWIGENVLIKPGVRIGNFSVVGANSIVVKDVVDFEIVGGVPARYIRFNVDHELYPRI